MMHVMGRITAGVLAVSLPVISPATAATATTVAKPAPGPDLAAAEVYVKGIYARLSGDFDYRSVRYAPALKALIARDDACAAAEGGICAIDSVPYCDCQDTSPDYRLMRSSVTAKGKGGARVTVEMRNFGPVRYSVDLVLIKGTWFVNDIITPTTPSFAAKLRKSLK